MAIALAQKKDIFFLYLFLLITILHNKRTNDAIKRYSFKIQLIKFDVKYPRCQKCRCCT